VRRTYLAGRHVWRNIIKMNDIVSEYHELLVRRESAASAKAALRLIDRIFSGNGRHWLDLAKQIASEAPRPLEPRIQWMLGKLPVLLEQMQATVPRDQLSFVWDVLLVLFHHAYFAIFAESDDRAGLLRAFRRFADRIPNVADRMQAMGFVHTAEKDFEKAAETFRAAVAARHADDHEFMTRLQLLWGFLLEHGRRDEAFRLLMDCYSRVSRKDLEETESLLWETFSTVPARKNGHAKTPALK
jgi:hypothetical protein